MQQGSLFDESLTNDKCIFCKIIRGDERAYILFENEISLAFLDTRPLFAGHCLLVPKEHHEVLANLPAALVAPLFQTAQLMEQAIEEALNADGTFIAINNRVSQSVPHLHVHIVPRHKKDGLKGFFWPRQPYKDETTIFGVQAAIREAIARIQTK